MIRALIIYYRSNIQKPDGSFIGGQSKMIVKDFERKTAAELKELAARITLEMMERDGVRQEALSFSGWFDVPAASADQMLE